MTRLLNVRCCCQPMKILGTLPWDGQSLYQRFKLTDGRELTLAVRAIQHYLVNVPEIAADQMSPEVEALAVERETAFKAEGAPLDQLRLIRQFKEGEFV